MKQSNYSIPEELKEKVSQLAKDDYTSASHIVRQALSQYLKGRGVL